MYYRCRIDRSNTDNFSNIGALVAFLSFLPTSFVCTAFLQSSLKSQLSFPRYNVSPRMKVLWISAVIESSRNDPITICGQSHQCHLCGDHDQEVIASLLKINVSFDHRSHDE